MVSAAIVELRRAVHSDQGLERRVQDAPDLETWVALVLEVAAERGLAVSRTEVEDAMNAARRAWLERWL